MTEPLLSVRDLVVEIPTRHGILKPVDGVSYDYHFDADGDGGFWVMTVAVVVALLRLSFVCAFEDLIRFDSNHVEFVP